MLPILAILVLGWSGGVLINYLADVLPLRRRPVVPFCLACEARQPWVRYLVWPRRCTACGRPRSARTWLVEAVFLGVSTWLWLAPPKELGFPAGYLLLGYFTLVAVIDIEHRLILHPVSLSGGLFGLAIGIWLHGLGRTLAGGAVGFAGMFLLYFLGAVFLRFSHRHAGLPPGEALGFGDVMLSGVLGLILGWPGIIAGLFLAIFLAGTASLLYLVVMVLSRRYQSNLAIPYGPFLVLSAALLLFFHAGLAARFGM